VVRDAIRALGDSSGYDLPSKRPSGKIAGALYDLAKWSTGSDRAGNPYSKPAVRAANIALGGNGIDLRRNSSLVKKGADASALALIERIEHAIAAGDSNVAAVAFERLDQWKARHGAWPFEAKRYWRAVDGLQALGMRRNGRRRSMRRNSSFGPDRDRIAARARSAFARGDTAAANRALAELRVIDIGLMPRAMRKNGRRMRRNPPIQFSDETRALAQRVYGK